MTAVQSLSKRRAVVTMLAVIAIVTATAVAHVWTHLRVIEVGYRISKATQQRDKLQELNRRLSVELAVLKAPARVAKVAAEKLGLRPSEPDQVRRLRLGGARSPTERQGGPPRGTSVARATPRLVPRAPMVATGPMLLPLGARRMHQVERRGGASR